jgi:hypothetical protein
MQSSVSEVRAAPSSQLSSQLFGEFGGRRQNYAAEDSLAANGTTSTCKLYKEAHLKSNIRLLNQPGHYPAVSFRR